MIDIAGAPQITEQGYKFVFRNFPRAPDIVGGAFAGPQDRCSKVSEHFPGQMGVCVLSQRHLRQRDQKRPSTRCIRKFNPPYKIVEFIAYDPQAAPPLGRGGEGEIYEALKSCWRCRWRNDGIILTREMVKQRWAALGDPVGGAGLVSTRSPYRKVLGRDLTIRLTENARDGRTRTKARTKLVLAAAGKEIYPLAPSGRSPSTMYTFEALLIVADAYKRVGSTAPQALADAIRTTNITNNASVGPGISFNAKGQNDKVRGAAFQNRGGKLVTLAPPEAANGRPEWPLPSYLSRG